MLGWISRKVGGGWRFEGQGAWQPDCIVEEITLIEH